MEPAVFQDIEDLLADTVVRIPDRGTGYFVAPNRILTCSHLFDVETSKPVKIEWKGCKGTLQINRKRTVLTPELPDLALLEVTWDGQSDVNHPCVLLGDESDQVGDKYFVFGHPKGSFDGTFKRSFEINGDKLRFDFIGFIQDDFGANWIKVSGGLATGGFSGSPFLNLRTRRVSGVLAVNLSDYSAVGARVIAASTVFDAYPDLRSLQTEFHSKNTRWMDLLPGPKLWSEIQHNCQCRPSHIQEGRSYYVARAIEKTFFEFLGTKCTAMAIVGQSGMGKTTLSAHLLEACLEGGHLAAMFDSMDLPPNLAEVESYIIKRLASAGWQAPEFWELINAECERRSKLQNRPVCLIVFIDAVNEYNSAGRDAPRPVHFLQKLNEMIGHLNRSHPRIKFVITCRPESWKKGMQMARRGFELNSHAYYEGPNGLAHQLLRFSEEESREAYEKYRNKYGIKTEYGRLRELTRYHFRDPLLLSLAAATYGSTQEKEIPLDLETGEVFAKFFQRLGTEGKDLIDAMVKQMFTPVGERISPCHHIVQRDTVARDAHLQEFNKFLFDSLDVGRADSPGLEMIQCNVLREWKSHSDSPEGTATFRFTYDRLAEYLISEELLKKIKDLRPQSGTLKEASVRVIKANLEGGQRMSTLFGALRRTLYVLPQQTGKDYPGILLEIASADSRGLSLVVSVLARTARVTPGGIEILRSFLSRLETDNDSKRAGSRFRAIFKRAPEKSAAEQFPIIEAVYRILRDEEYRLWLAEQKEAERANHLNLLYGYFGWGFRHSQRNISATAIQYLFFLWQYRRGLDDANAITGRLIDQIQPFSIGFLCNTGQKRLVPNLAGLSFLILAELREEPQADLARNAVLRLVRQLRLRSSGFFWLLPILNRILVKYFIDILKNVPNPIDFESLSNYFYNYEENSRNMGPVLKFLGDPSCTPAMMRQRVKEIAMSDNSWVLQNLAFAISACYEKSPNAPARLECLDMIRRLCFDEASSPTQEYCASLALYHINYFGGHASPESMALMRDAAALILDKRKGVLEIAGRKRNYNIIGTFGRALHRNGGLLRDSGTVNVGACVFQYAIDALEFAKKNRDESYYLYICENIGLLGVLIEPSQVFDVVTHILQDIRAIPGKGERDTSYFPFPDPTADSVKQTIIQSLANIRILHRQGVDYYLLETLDQPELYAGVANQAPEFDLSTFYSWSFEHLIFRFLNEYYDDVGAKVIVAFGKGVERHSAGACMEEFLGQLLKNLSDISP